MTNVHFQKKKRKKRLLLLSINKAQRVWLLVVLYLYIELVCICLNDAQMRYFYASEIILFFVVHILKNFLLQSCTNKNALQLWFTKGLYNTGPSILRCIELKMASAES